MKDGGRSAVNLANLLDEVRHRRNRWPVGEMPLVICVICGTMGAFCEIEVLGINLLRGVVICQTVQSRDDVLENVSVNSTTLRKTKAIPVAFVNLLDGLRSPHPLYPSFH